MEDNDDQILDLIVDTQQPIKRRNSPNYSRNTSIVSSTNQKFKLFKIPKLGNSKFSLISDLELYNSNKKLYFDRDYCYSFFKQLTVNEIQMKNLILPYLIKSPKKLFTIFKNVKEIYSSKVECIAKLQTLSQRLPEIGNKSLSELNFYVE